MWIIICSFRPRCLFLAPLSFSVSGSCVCKCSRRNHAWCRCARLRVCLLAYPALSHPHRHAFRTRLSSTHALARLEWFSSYLSATCLLKTEGKDLIPLDLVPSFLCILRKNAHLHLYFQGLQEGGGGMISLPRSQQFCLRPGLMLAKFSACLPSFLCLFWSLWAPW